MTTKRMRYSRPRLRPASLSPQDVLLNRLKKLQAADPDEPLTLRSLRVEHDISPILVRELEDTGQVQIIGIGTKEHRVIVAGKPKSAGA